MRFKKPIYIMDIDTGHGMCPVGVVEESLAKDTCKWKTGWTVCFTLNGCECLCTEDTASTLDVPEYAFMDLAVSVAGQSGMFLRCYPAKYDDDDIKCLTDLFFKNKRNAIRFVKKIAEYKKENLKRG